MHSLLKKSFDQNFFHYDQKPITSTFAYNSQVKIAGMAYANLNFDDEDSVISVPQNVSHLLNKKKKINLLQSIKEKAEHMIIRKRFLLSFYFLLEILKETFKFNRIEIENLNYSPLRIRRILEIFFKEKFLLKFLT